MRKLLVHQQTDEVRVEVEWRAVRMVRGHEDAPRILDEQEQLEADGPLQRVHVALVAILHRHDAAARVALDVHHHPLLRMGGLGIAVLAHAVAGSRARLAEQDLADVDRHVLMLVQERGDLGGAGGELEVALGAVAVELNVRQVHRQAFGGADGRQGRVHVAGDAEITSVDVDRMRNSELLHAARKRENNVARGEAVVDVLLVEVERTLIELEGADAAGVDDLDRQRLRSVHGPGDVVLDEGEVLLLCKRAQEEVVAAKHHERALVDHGRVAHLEVRLPRIGRQHGRLEGGRVAHLGIAVAGGHGGGHSVAAARARQIGARDRIVLVVLRQHHTADGHLAAADVAVRIDGAGHDDTAVKRILPIDARAGWRRSDDAAVLGVDVAHLAVDPIHRVIDFSAGELDEHGGRPRGGD